MSRENVAAVEAAYDALARGGLDQFIEDWTDDLDNRSIEAAPDDRGPIHGKDATPRTEGALVPKRYHGTVPI